MLQTSQLSCERNGRFLFEGLSFTVSPGELLRLEGSNGAGKTTLLRILCGLYEDYDGQVEWDLDDYPLFVGHRPGVKDLLSAAENLTWLARLYGEDIGAQAIASALDRVGLLGYRDIACGEMSEGQRKRVNLARLFLLRSPAWILDEPFSSIDAAGVSDLQDVMDTHLESGGIIILTSHQPLSVRGNVQTLALSAP